mmetsp:Transcript_18277/g.16163  ORF Transcript_18277/g.16163 Transcript_18277/m.16163 type:complete len:124 (-) Transcript_18277:479-850(-)
MKLTDSFTRPGTSGESQGLADLKLGMNSINRTGIQQNTSSLFAKQFPKRVKAKEEPVVDKRVSCRGHCGYRKKTRDQRNPYLLQNRKRPLTNLSSYLKASRGITDEEENKIIDLIEVFKNRVK